MPASNLARLLLNVSKLSQRLILCYYSLPFNLDQYCTTRCFVARCLVDFSTSIFFIANIDEQTKTGARIEQANCFARDEWSIARSVCVVKMFCFTTVNFHQRSTPKTSPSKQLALRARDDFKQTAAFGCEIDDPLLSKRQGHASYSLFCCNFAYLLAHVQLKACSPPVTKAERESRTNLLALNLIPSPKSAPNLSPDLAQSSPN